MARTLVAARRHRGRRRSAWPRSRSARRDPLFRRQPDQAGILPRLLEARLGQSAYNLAVLGGQPPTSLLSCSRRVLDGGHSPRALVVNFSPCCSGLDPRVNLEWWAQADRRRERHRAGLPLRGSGAGGIADPSRRDRVAVGPGGVPGRPSDRFESPTSTSIRRGTRRARCSGTGRQPGCPGGARPFVPIQGSLPRPYDGPGWNWQPHPVHAEFVERFLALAEERRIPVYWIIPPAEAAWLERNERVGTVGAYRRYVRESGLALPGADSPRPAASGLGPSVVPRSDPPEPGRGGATHLGGRRCHRRERGDRDAGATLDHDGRSDARRAPAIPGSAGRPRPVAPGGRPGQSTVRSRWRDRGDERPESEERGRRRRDATTRVDRVPHGSSGGHRGPADGGAPP